MELDPDSLTFARDRDRLNLPLWTYQRAVDRGRLVRIHRGVYSPRALWVESSETEKYTFRVIGAVAASRTPQIVSHISAAVLWGAPIIGPMPTLIHVLCTEAAGTRTEHRMRKHASKDLAFDLEHRGELKMTGIARTVAEVAADSSFVTAVGVIDWALRKKLVTKPQLLWVLEQLQIRRGRRAALRAIDFGDGQSGSPGESLSRVRIHEAGFPRPVLQQRFRDARGFIGFVDFWWPEHRLIGEFDGVAKYVREEFTGDRTAAEVIIDEKRREDRLRATGPRVTRWDWSVAWPERRLAAHLSQAGLPSPRSFGFAGD